MRESMKADRNRLLQSHGYKYIYIFFCLFRSGGVMIYFDRIEVVNYLIPSAGELTYVFISVIAKELFTMSPLPQSPSFTWRRKPNIPNN